MKKLISFLLIVSMLSFSVPVSIAQDPDAGRGDSVAGEQAGKNTASEALGGEAAEGGLSVTNIVLSILAIGVGAAALAGSGSNNATPATNHH